MDDCFKLLHFHLGSQITNIRHIKGALERSGADLRRPGQARAPGWSISTSAAGWASTTTARRPTSSRASTTRCRSTPTTSSTTCRASATKPGVPHPDIISESGRAVVAYHSVLVFGVLGVSEQGEANVPTEVPDDAEQPLRDLLETLRNDLTARNVLESYHDAQQALDMAMNLFSGGLPAARPAQPRREPVLGHLPQDPASWCRQLDYVPEELQGLDALLSDTYFCNFSLFQSMPDSWAIKQLFPVMPIHRLDERPDAARRAGRHHLRLRRQDRPVHRPPRRQADAAAAHASTASPTTWAPS